MPSNIFHPNFPTAQDWVNHVFEKEYENGKVLAELYQSSKYRHNMHSPAVMARFRARQFHYNVHRRAHAVHLLEAKLTDLFKEVTGKTPPSWFEIDTEE